VLIGVSTLLNKLWFAHVTGVGTLCTVTHMIRVTNLDREEKDYGRGNGSNH
jgi:hypothetical protein